MNSGTASNVKLFKPLNIFVKTTMFGISASEAMPAKDTTPNAKEIGTPIATNTMNITTRTTPIYLPSLFAMSLISSIIL